MNLLNSTKKLARIGVSAVKEPSKTVQKTGAAVQKVGKKVGTASAETSKKAVKSTFINVKPKDGKPAERLENLYTGKRLNPIHGTAAAGLYLAGSNMKSSVERPFAQLQLAVQNNYAEIGSPNIMSYDGVGQQSAPKNLNANGSIVFGLHNMRKG